MRRKRNVYLLGMACKISLLRTTERFISQFENVSIYMYSRTFKMQRLIFPPAARTTGAVLTPFISPKSFPSNVPIVSPQTHPISPNPRSNQGTMLLDMDLPTCRTLLSHFVSSAKLHYEMSDGHDQTSSLSFLSFSTPINLEYESNGTSSNNMTLFLEEDEKDGSDGTSFRKIQNLTMRLRIMKTRNWMTI